MRVLPYLVLRMVLTLRHLKISNPTLLFNPDMQFQIFVRVFSNSLVISHCVCKIDLARRQENQEETRFFNFLNYTKAKVLTLHSLY